MVSYEGVLTRIGPSVMVTNGGAVVLRYPYLKIGNRVLENVYTSVRVAALLEVGAEVRLKLSEVWPYRNRLILSVEQASGEKLKVGALFVGMHYLLELSTFLLLGMFLGAALWMPFLDWFRNSGTLGLWIGMVPMTLLAVWRIRQLRTERRAA
jgi:hypothetical protein